MLESYLRVYFSLISNTDVVFILKWQKSVETVVEVLFWGFKNM